MAIKVSSTDFQNNFGKYLKLCRHQNIIITRNGNNKAVMVCFPDKAEGFEAAEILPVYGTSPRRPNHVTYRDFKELVEQSDSRYELIDGVVYLLASPGFSHQRILGEMYVWFNRYFEDKEGCDAFLSPFDIELMRRTIEFYRETDEDDINVVQPDLLVLCDYWKDINEEDRYKGTPSLGVEILSPSTRTKDKTKKFDLYMESGMDELWIVDPKLKTIEVSLFREYQIEDVGSFSGLESAASFRYPGLTVPLGKVFPTEAGT